MCYHIAYLKTPISFTELVCLSKFKRYSEFLYSSSKIFKLVYLNEIVYPALIYLPRIIIVDFELEYLIKNLHAFHVSAHQSLIYVLPLHLHIIRMLAYYSSVRALTLHLHTACIAACSLHCAYVTCILYFALHVKINLKLDFKTKFITLCKDTKIY